MLASLLRKVSKANSLRSIQKYIKTDFNFQKFLQRNETIDFVRSKLLSDSFRILFPKETQLNLLHRCHNFNTFRQRVFLTFPGHQIRNESTKKFKLVKRRSIVEELAESEKKLRESKQATKSNTQDQKDIRDNRSLENSQESFKDEAKKSEGTEKYAEKCEHSDQKDSEYSKDRFCLNKASAVPCNRRASCCTQKEECSSDGLKPLIEEEMAAPDPPPPKPNHWTETLSRRRKSQRQVSSPMIYIPYQESKPKKSPPKYVDETRECDPPEQSCCKSVKTEKDNFVAYGCSSQPVGDSNTEALKYRLSKCPSMIGTLKSDKKEQETVEPKRPVSEEKLEKRKRVRGYQSSGEWRKQKYQVRLRIYKQKDHLNPCPPVVTESSKVGAEFVEPRLSPVHRELAKKVRNPCPPKYCPNVDVGKTKLKGMKKKKVRRMKCPQSNK